MSPFVYKRLSIKCPFCRETMVIAYHELEEIDALPPKLPKNRIIAGRREDLDTTYDYCPHTAFFCYWGYTEPEIVPAYRDLFLKMAEKLELAENGLEGAIAVYFTDSDEELLAKALKSVLPKIRVKTVNICLAGESRPQWNQPGIVQVIFIKVPVL